MFHHSQEGCQYKHAKRCCVKTSFAQSLYFSLNLSVFPLPSSPTSGRPQPAAMQTLLEQKTRQLELVQAEYDDFIASSKGLVHWIHPFYPNTLDTIKSKLCILCVEYERELEAELESAQTKIQKILQDAAHYHANAGTKCVSCLCPLPLSVMSPYVKSNCPIFFMLGTKQMYKRLLLQEMHKCY